MLGVVWKGPKEGNQGQEKSFLGTSLCDTAIPHQTCHQSGAAHGHALSPPQEDIQRGCGCLQVCGVVGRMPLGGQAGALVRGCLGSVPLTSPLPILPCRSAIHGRGLFCKRNIDAGERVIEYSGIGIRSVLTDKREKFYDGKVGSARPWE